MRIAHIIRVALDEQDKTRLMDAMKVLRFDNIRTERFASGKHGNVPCYVMAEEETATSEVI